FNLVTRTSVIKNVLVSFVPDLPLWRKLTGIFTKDHKIKALEALDKVGILDKAYMRVDQLSGGQQQRVALARTLAQNPDIILADEPIASLDPVTSRMVMDDFKRINQEMNISVIMNIHHVEVALEYADRIIGIRQGEVVFDGEASGVTTAVLGEIYGGRFEEEMSVQAEAEIAYV
ncbi:phosphonate ABC transporter ATP-binding protein, partial [Paenibacillus glucanolyticus]